MIDVYKNKIDLSDRYMYYKKRIESVIYPKSEFEKLNYVDYETYDIEEKQELTKQIRLKMLKQKYNHSLRVTNIIENLNTIMETSEEVKELSMVSGLLHDYGRFIQAVYHNTFFAAEEYYKEKGYNGHGEVGAHLLFNLNDINYFHIDEALYEYIEPVVKYHQINKLKGNLNLRFNNESYKKWEIVSGMIQMVKDADMYDILYQRLNGEYPIFSRMLYFNVNNMSIEEISKISGVSIEDIKKTNELNNNDISSIKYIKLPFKKVDTRILEVPEYLKKMFFDKVYITDPSKWDLRNIQKNTNNYNSITAMWWSIGQFLSNINFTATLKLLKEQKILEKIYELYPKEYRYLVKDMFEFSSEELLDKRIEQGNTYAKKIL